LAANVAENSVLFCAYGFCQQFVLYLKPNDQKVNSNVGQTKSLTVLDNALAGFFAAFFSSFTLCPTELIKCKLQALRETGHSSMLVYFNLHSEFNNIKKKNFFFNYRTSFGLTKEILRNDGFKGMFRGLSSTMMREMPGYFFFFGSYELSKNLLRSSQDEEDLGLIKTIICGGFGGIGLWVSIFPFDVVKSRIQVNSSKERMIKVLVHIIRNEGFGALYKGLFPTVLRTFPSTGALFVCFENSKYFMTKLLDNQF
jgi:solute carrier family 25 ornithine transporter 2/15